MTALYRLENVCLRHGGRTALCVPELEIPAGSIFGLAGHNGSGKSTLLRLLALLEKPSQGRVLVDGADAAGRELELRRGITLLDQEPYLLRRSVLENVLYGLRVRGDGRDLKARAAEALEWVGLPAHFAQRSWRELSGGEAQRVALAARLVLKPRVLLLDEPTASLDAESVTRINEAALRARKEWGTTLILVSHDLSWLFDMADKVLNLHQGKAAGFGRINVIRGPWGAEPGGSVRLLADGQRVLAPPAPSPDSAAVCSARDVSPGTEAAPPPGDSVLRATIRAVAATGEGLLLHCRAGELGLRVLAGDLPAERVRPGETLLLGIARSALRHLEPTRD